MASGWGNAEGLGGSQEWVIEESLLNPDWRWKQYNRQHLFIVRNPAVSRFSVYSTLGDNIINTDFNVFWPYLFGEPHLTLQAGF